MEVRADEAKTEERPARPGQLVTMQAAPAWRMFKAKLHLLVSFYRLSSDLAMIKRLEIYVLAIFGGIIGQLCIGLARHFWYWMLRNYIVMLKLNSH